MMLHASILITITGTASAFSSNMVQDKDYHPGFSLSTDGNQLSATHLSIRWNKDGEKKAFIMPLCYDNVQRHAWGNVVFTGYQRPRPLEDSWGFWVYKHDDSVRYGYYAVPNSELRAGYDTRVRCRVQAQSISEGDKHYAKITIDLGCNKDYDALSGSHSGECIELHDHLMACGKGSNGECLDNCEGRGVRFEAQVELSQEELILYNNNMNDNIFACIQPFHKVKLFSRTKGYKGSSPRIQYLCPKHHQDMNWDSEQRGTEVLGCFSGMYMGRHEKWVFDESLGHSKPRQVAKEVKLQKQLWKTEAKLPTTKLTLTERSGSRGGADRTPSLRKQFAADRRRNGQY